MAVRFFHRFPCDYLRTNKKKLARGKMMGARPTSGRRLLAGSAPGSDGGIPTVKAHQKGSKMGGRETVQGWRGGAIGPIKIERGEGGAGAGKSGDSKT